MATKRKEQGKEQGESQRSAKRPEESQDLKQREYRDKEGNIHHHTRKWMEDHGGGESEK
jgi:hypothetical protein